MVPPAKRKAYNGQKLKPIIKLLRSRELGASQYIDTGQIPESSSKFPFVWQRRSLNPGHRNKIFACQWITNNYIVYGTKCNNLVLYDCTSNESFDIPLIKAESPDVSHINPCACGIHSIQLNTSKTFLATGGDNVNHIGVYKLSEFSPHCLLCDCHNDWVFDLRWLDDTCIASCSRDSSLALWRIPSPTEYSSNDNELHRSTRSTSNSSVLHIRRPIGYAMSSTPDDRFRALEYLPIQTSLAVVSMSRRLYLYDAIRMGLDKRTRPVYTLVLRDAYQEAVALRRWPAEPNCIALATHHCVLLFDIRCSTAKVGAAVRCILPPLDISGVRSLNFAESILSYGTSSGQVHFYDLKSDHHLPIQLDIGPGWVKPQTCDEFEISSIVPPTVSPVSRLVSQHHTTDPGSSTWNVPSPPPSPAHPALLTRSVNTVRPLQLRAEIVNNIRVRLDRIQHRLSNLRSRRSMAVAGALNTYPVVDVSMFSRSNYTNRQSDTSQQNITTENGSESSLSESYFPIDDFQSTTDTETGLNSVDSNNRSPDEPNEIDASSTQVVMPFSLPRLHIRDPHLGPIFLGMNYFANIHSDFVSFPTFFNQRRMLAVYTHEYDPSGTRLFTAGGPIASTFYGNVAALWE
ncbi:DDB1- and CUL4-associated factor 12 isoform 1 [Schistosoma japonicum]|uniref:DDB1-and CUL4-associated factor 12 isoform 1 n=1 Tax=Schistosoma japonicum TaxID=6182 RepID=A0A4Z2CTV6_SCHJA|nr:DDB1- and CUL4-associated factor 12 [Schistosoma japonicum]TNN07739.1 DDB1- and CUL4-associated factor 12 isoform 1 [Schistosoma japonicum]